MYLITYYFFLKQSTVSEHPKEKRKLKKQVSFGSTKEINYEPTYEGGFAYNAVMTTRMSQKNDQRRKSPGVILGPDHFSINLVVENQSKTNTSFYGSGCTNSSDSPSVKDDVVDNTSTNCSNTAFNLKS